MTVSDFTSRKHKPLTQVVHVKCLDTNCVEIFGPTQSKERNTPCWMGGNMAFFSFQNADCVDMFGPDESNSSSKERNAAGKIGGDTILTAVLNFQTDCPKLCPIGP